MDVAGQAAKAVERQPGQPGPGGAGGKQHGAQDEEQALHGIRGREAVYEAFDRRMDALIPACCGRRSRSTCWDISEVLECKLKAGAFCMKFSYP
ncbi:hypothetical protein CBM2589_A90633 [Cupriavidus taiwanensis]|uniref:Uncharacterized protein n=1 Tax=Cupriavidus taiwanensis TaxID=164546 RepID=A0A975XGF0_9BURK|nr:hypothetical protein CBM2589_A90633 [Cupriavidus taiwanensis]